MNSEAPPSPWFSVGDGDVRLLRDGVQAFPAMLDAIARAEREIVLEIYWVGDDDAGERFRAALTARARAGVRVRVVYDAVGSIGISDAWWNPLVAAGGEVFAYRGFFRALGSFKFANFEHRDHRKILVVDAHQGFTGGVNLARPWLPCEQGGDGWRDDMLQVRGGAAQELRTLFFRTWRRVARRPIPPDVRRLRRDHAAGLWVLSNNRGLRWSIREEYLRRIRRARSSVDIANSYFVPDLRVQRALAFAARRGVRVRVLVPAHADVSPVEFAMQAQYGKLLRRGIELYEFSGPMLHSKTAIIDSRFTTIGSYNLDHRSWRKNLEANIAVESEPFARHVTEWFEVDLRGAERVGLETWKMRPLGRRTLEWVAYGLRKFW